MTQYNITYHFYAFLHRSIKLSHLNKATFREKQEVFSLKSAERSSKTEQNFAPRDRPSLNSARLKCLETGGDKLRKKENVEANIPCTI